ncbi:MAG: hypothetical protein AAB296_05460, partial [Candidatus Desantisbacteria bacterium]
SVSPASAIVGKQITIIGDGYIGGVEVNLAFGAYPTIAVGTASLSGTFSTIFTLNEQVGGSLTITAYSTGAAHQSTAPFYIKANVHTVIPTTGTVGTWVQLTGNGYRALGTVTVHFGAIQSVAATQASVVVNGVGGTFTCGFTINTQPYGTTTITAAGLINSATRSFTILPNIFRVSPNTGTVGTRVTVAGNGYPTGAISLNFGTKTAIVTGTMETSGSFTIAFTINTQIYGTTTITGVGTNGVFFVRTLVIQPNIWRVSPNNGTVGIYVTVYGNGYGAGETVNIGFGTTPLITATATAGNGSWTAVFTVNNQSIGSNTITASGLNTGTAAVSSFMVKPMVTSITPTQGSVGTVVTITGNGYQASEAIRVDFGNTSSITQVSAEADGSFQTAFTIDTQKYGTTTSVACGVQSQGSANIGFKITTNIVSVSPSEGTVGSSVTVTGDGFEYGPIGIDFGQTPTLANGMSSVNGSFSINLVVDTQFYGTQAVKASMTNNLNVFAEKTFFIWHTIDEITPNKGTVGTTITVKGTGFDAGDVIKLKFGVANEWDISVASQKGSFTGTFIINAQVYGTTTVVVRGFIPPEQEISTTLVILPGIYMVTPAKGSIGTPVTVIGTGFVATDVVNITFGNTSNISTATVGSDGLFTAYFTINTQQLGTTTVSASGTLSTSAMSTFRIIPSIILLSPGQGMVGTTVSIKGNGYNGSELVRISFGDRTTITTVTANIAGEFATSFVVDTQAYGTTSVGAIGVISQVSAQEWTFVILPAIVNVTPTTGTIGSCVTIYGNGYDSDHVIKVNFGTTASITQTMSEDCGSFTAVFTVNTQVYGVTKIIANEEIAQDISDEDNSFTIWPNIILSPIAGTVGSTVEVQGNGYSASDLVRISFGIAPTITDEVANNIGVFTKSFTVDLQPCGTTTVKGIGSAPIIPEKSFNILSNITGVIPAIGSITTMVTVTGNGFGASEQIWVKFGITGSITSTTTDIYGSFTALF